MSEDKKPLDLEVEFSNLMEEVILKIKANKKSGLYADWEASYLERQVKNLIDHGDTTNYGEQCPLGCGNIDDCGWSPSMGYHCI
jgi:hypothetical protein